MSKRQTNEYLRTKVLTASQEELQLMLYEGAIRFTEQAKAALEKKDAESSYNLLMRAQKIVLELTNSLRPDVNPELCAQLASLYNFIYRRLVDANVRRSVQAADEALKILRMQRDTWLMLMEKLTSERASQAAPPVPHDPHDSGPATGQTPSINIQG